MKPLAPQRWVLATASRGKLAEFRALLPGDTIELLTLGELGLTGPEETGSTFVENALLKARHAAAATGLPAIAEDSGLVVAALGGAPGVRSARFAAAGAADDANIDALLEALKGVPPSDRGAAFVCVIVALRSATDPDPIIAHGRWVGSIATVRRGTDGFGYDPVFADPASGRTAAELSAAEKNARSHRGRACRALLRALKAEPGPR